MSDYDAARIKKRSRRGNGRQQNIEKEKFIIGFDSEADTSSLGRPMLFQFSLPDTAEEETVCYEIDPVRPHAGLRAFLDFLDTYCTDRRYQYHVYGWNLSYELTQLFHDLPPHIRVLEEFELHPQTAAGDKDYSDWVIKVSNGKRVIVLFTKGKNISVKMIDGRAFYMTSLDKAARMLGLGEKYTMVEGLSRSMFTREHLHDEEFLTYAKRDAYITRLIGQWISLQHDVLDIPTTISAPQMAATVYQKNYAMGPLPQVGVELEQAGLYSYHGGKNGYYADGPLDIGAWNYDITSAYPEAMRQLPDPDNSGWQPVRVYSGQVHGVYLVRGFYRRCVYRGLQNHDGKWTPAGSVDGVWTTGYELQAMLDLGEFDISDATGFVMVGPTGGSLQRYVDHYFKQKQTTTGPERETAKLMLNSLYGKFFQKQPLGVVEVFALDSGEIIRTDPSAQYDYEAGGLYHPPIASLITGYVRARIHRLEHKYGSLMTSTDGFFGTEPPDPADMGSHLGGLKGTHGRLRIWRERLYIFDDDDGTRKYALHGFRNTVGELEKVPLARGEYKYTGRQMITLKQSNSQHGGVRYEPGAFATLQYTLVI